MSDFVKIIGVNEEAYDTKTFEFQWDEKAIPGQFIMVWVPGMEEIPMSLSKTGRIKSITVKAIGASTRKLHELTIGDSLRIRGPYGKGFDLTKGKKILIIGGGVGTASVMPAIKESGADAIIGARTNKDVIMDDLGHKYAKNLWISTDDGSMGFHGNAVQLMREKVAENNYEIIIACGPEIMLYYIYQACVELNLDCQLSLERHMKCGAGICGCCVIDDQRVCKDGPVFTKEQISKMKDFGVQKRDECGRILKFR
ncbi:MAG: dihydroorotate dehydrogenase electron transfer subunit [Candidatus Methanomethylophilaceae archaeon]|nr:dihydroorotate dehydrogenase electron transfer subunit [Candidatus Methanomethylophilaceae archaeon]MDD3379310.1 dihydroorotate dehydrogenase electron transfer subunit [Candidatus Methanomethylophilaceae archaeon]MDY0224785.1 dihydroorotate dehydrogenase electron transfer subunit [Candidatus Methanomethylophilaceae archaeon]